MLARLAMLFLLIFIGEMMLLFWLADEAGWNVALGEVLLTGVLGTLVVRWQGVWTFRKVQQKLESQETPATALIDGLLIFIAGLFLITPGLVTDTIGVLLLIPPSRLLFKAGFVYWFLKRFKMNMTGGPSNGSDGQEPRHKIIDVEVVNQPPEQPKQLEED